jgi:hypothetical protein
MCMSKGYYKPIQKIAEAVATDLVETKNVSLIAYYLEMAYQLDQHTYMNDLAWIYERVFSKGMQEYYNLNWSDEEVESLESHIREMIDIDDEDILQFERIFADERPDLFEDSEF